MTEELTERIKELENRVGYLEQETGYRYDEAMFKRRVSNIFPREPEVDSCSFGYSASLVVDGSEADLAISRLSNYDDLGWELRSTDGEGVELYVSTDLVRHG